MPGNVQLDIRKLVAELMPAVLEAGAIEMGYYRGTVTVEQKADQSPVTAADREAEAILLAALARIAPDIPVIAEEAASEGRIPTIGRRFFLVDPLDGTREFINRRDEFTVNVALIEAARPVFGIVYAPALGEVYATLAAGEAGIARVPLGAPGDVHADVQFEPIRTRRPDMTALTAVASRSHMTPETEAFLGAYTIAERRDSGSSLKFCVIARGNADIYPRLAPTMEWDIAAGHAVLAAAGGSVTAPDGSAFVYGKATAGFRNGHFVAWGTPKPFPLLRD
jgi:3'(2'), 5'-bisphosphate nucleotidase